MLVEQSLYDFVAQAECASLEIGSHQRCTHHNATVNNGHLPCRHLQLPSTDIEHQPSTPAYYKEVEAQARHTVERQLAEIIAENHVIVAILHGLVLCVQHTDANGL